MLWYPNSGLLTLLQTDQIPFFFFRFRYWFPRKHASGKKIGPTFKQSLKTTDSSSAITLYK